MIQPMITNQSSPSKEMDDPRIGEENERIGEESERKIERKEIDKRESKEQEMSL